MEERWHCPLPGRQKVIRSQMFRTSPACQTGRLVHRLKGLAYMSRDERGNDAHVRAAVDGHAESGQKPRVTEIIYLDQRHRQKGQNHDLRSRPTADQHSGGANMARLDDKATGAGMRVKSTRRPEGFLFLVLPSRAAPSQPRAPFLTEVAKREPLALLSALGEILAVDWLMGRKCTAHAVNLAS